MEITEKLIQAQRDNYVSQRNQAQANIAACEGAIQDCDFWLLKLKEPSVATSESSTTQPPETP